jgi:hypothetical protein
MPQMVYYRNNNRNNGGIFESLFSIPIIGQAIGLSVLVIVIGVLYFLGVSIFTTIICVVVPAFIKISTWAISAAEIGSGFFLGFEYLVIGVLLGVVKKYLICKKYYYQYSLRTDKTFISTIVLDSFIAFSFGWFSSLTGVYGILQKVLFNNIIDSKSIIGIIIVSGGMGGFADNGGILLFLLILFLFIIQGIIIGAFIGLIFGSFSGIIAGAVKNGFIKTIFLLGDGTNDAFGKSFIRSLVKGTVEGIIFGCMNGLLCGIINSIFAVNIFDKLK